MNNNFEKKVREILTEYSKQLLFEHFGGVVANDFGCKECVELLEKTMVNILEATMKRVSVEEIEKIIEQIMFAHHDDLSKDDDDRIGEAAQAIHNLIIGGEE